TIRNTYIMGADLYEQPHQIAENDRASRPHVGIGAGSVIEGALIDKNARIGRGVQIRNDGGVVDSEESPHYVIRDGIVVIPKFTALPDRFVI
ncbi:MAG: glucose-1-phosphate adenylyltransferase, partial [Planctomycetaceae bacterium]|nr:glucose-1-phosphate adenylyltransferase [Planctomycetaceae bacterium]